jgi:DNA repair protein RecO (recombination protein O)
MLHKTKGIVINYIKYSETSIITKIYTEELGLQTYIVNGVRSKNSKNKIALFQPLTLLDLVVYFKQSTHIHRLSEVRCHYPYKTINFENKKSAILFFLTEVLSKSIHEEIPNKELFDFLYHSIIFFDNIEEDYENFHLQFLLQLSGFLGFGPSSPDDLLNTGLNKLNKDEYEFCQALLNSNYNTVIKTSNVIRRRLLDHILVFYSLHTPNFEKINSVKILNEVLRND